MHVCNNGMTYFLLKFTLQLTKDMCMRENDYLQWLSRWIHNPVFPGSNPGGGKVDSALHPSEVCEMSSSIINAAQVCRGCADRPRSPR